ncbi:hypothetical protein GJ699_13685 [Duganella sp. FT80W]|uniref:Uncharacterized protein n=1 Tax=Duganella guangzhouensis TaxID=2666084 RepID=A0A6I2KZR1_9BURK|nr:hypothetical protein [Duganella guangzhouensis]MRW91042.1 hypothetical protein [Duganella guangzhouensis]
MIENTLSPFSVVSFSKDFLVELVRHKTGWDQRNEVSDKTQLNYLCNYLAAPAMGCKTIVVEDEYIDRHYLEDYSAYYARCFPHHPRKCSRVHFFKSNFEQQDFVSRLATSHGKLNRELQENYLGFVVIRPIPHTFFAKICLVPYPTLCGRQGAKILTREVPVSLFGLKLAVETVPFLEQDKVVSACATSAVWTALSASRDSSISQLPSPSSITRAATSNKDEGTRTFPTIGLTPPQVARSFKSFGYEPSIFEYKGLQAQTELKEHVFSHLQNGTPVVLGGEVYEIKEDQSLSHLGKHLVCVVGYSILPTGQANGLKFRSHDIDKIYIHDDRYGPYVKVRMAPKSLKLSDHEITGFALAFEGSDNDLFVPEIAIVGLDHKVRIPYSHIFNICTAFSAYSSLSSSDIAKTRTEVPQDDIATVDELSNIFAQIANGSWEIALTSSTQLKQEILSDESFQSFNGLYEKSSLLLQSMPRHIWRARLHVASAGKLVPFTDLVFDATEVPQGRVLIGYIAYTTEAISAWENISSMLAMRVWQNYNLGDNVGKQYIGCIVKFFSELRNRTYLNSLYGPAGLPRRSLKPGESDAIDDIQLRPDTFTVRRGSRYDWGKLDTKIKYIWVINELGDLVMGEDKFSVTEGEEQFQGHPTLIDGKPGRVAGEILYVPEHATWAINLQSRAYSGHLDKRSTEARSYLENVIKHNLDGLNVKVQADLAEEVTPQRTDDTLK